MTMRGFREFLRYLSLVEASLAVLSAAMSMYITSDTAFSPGVFAYFFLMLFLFTSMFGPATALRLVRARGAGPVDARLPLGLVAFFFVALIVLTFFVPFGFGDVRTEGYVLYNEPLPPASVTLNRDMEGLNYIGGNVEFEGNVTVRNATLVFSAGSRAWVSSGSTLRMENVTLELHRSQFEVYGTLIAENVVFRDPWGDAEHMNGDGGVEIYGSVFMENAVIEGGATNGLLLHNASAHLVNVTVVANGDDGIEVHRSTLRAERLTVKNNTWSIVAFESDLYLTDSAVTGNTYGIALDDSRLTLNRSTVEGNREWDLLRIGDSQVYSSDSRVGVEGTISFEDPSAEAYLMLCVSIYMISFIMALTYTHWVLRTMGSSAGETEEKLFNYG